MSIEFCDDHDRIWPVDFEDDDWNDQPDDEAIIARQEDDDFIQWDHGQYDHG